jgi:Pyruvate/2-oxoacid:ferredoxin oxidoreductase delta subunit
MTVLVTAASRHGSTAEIAEAIGRGVRRRVDLDYCKGCGLYATECPCGAVEMVPEQT